MNIPADIHAGLLYPCCFPQFLQIQTVGKLGHLATRTPCRDIYMPLQGWLEDKLMDLESDVAHALMNDLGVSAASPGDVQAIPIPDDTHSPR